MSKLRLDLEALAVDSFAMADEGDARGTVWGRGGQAYEPCPRTDESTCNPNEVCGCIPSWVITCAGASSCDLAAAAETPEDADAGA